MSTSDEPATAFQYLARAKANLTPGAWDYLMGGSETETTLNRNRRALDSLAFRPRVLRDVSDIDLSTTLFGHKMRIPVMLAPIGSLQDIIAEGGTAPTRAAASFGTLHMLSSVAHPGLEEVATIRNSSSSMCAATPTGSMRSSAAPSTMVMPRWR